MLRNTTIKIKRVSLDAIIPSYKTKGASGADIYTNETVIIEPQQACKIRTGIALEMPEEVEAQLRPRSSTSLNPAISVDFGTIDNDYRGEVHVIVYNRSNSPVLLERNTRVAQIVFSRVYSFDFEEVQELEPTDRGSKGFGSTN